MIIRTHLGKRRLLFAASSGAVVVGASAALAFGGAFTAQQRVQASATTHRAAAPATPQELGVLHQVAVQLAKANEGTPGRIDVVSTDRQAANQLDSGATVSSDEPVYMVSMPGHFVAHFANPPDGSARPAGNALTFTYDPAQNSILDISVGPAEPALGQLGPVQTISP